jgi:hypothetical protein
MLAFIYKHVAKGMGLVPLKLYYNEERRDNFTTATQDGIRDAEASGYTFVRDEGYITPRR